MKRIKYKLRTTSVPSPMRNRRFLKLICKNTQRYFCEQLKNNVAHGVACQKRDEAVSEALATIGLSGNWHQLNSALSLKDYFVPKSKAAKGRHFFRLGKAAKKKGTTVNVWHIAIYVKQGKDLRTIRFDNEKVNIWC